MNTDHYSINVAKNHTLSFSAMWSATACATLFAGIYLDIAYPVFGGSFPMASAVPGAVMSAIMWPNKTVKFFIISILISAFFMMFSMLSPDSSNNISFRINATAQVFWSIIISAYSYQYISQTSRSKLNFILYFIIFSIILFLIIEIFSPLKEVTQAFSSQFQGREDDFQIAFSRDEAIAGGYRPILFSAEPSYLALAAFVLSFGILFTNQNKNRYAISLFISTIFALLIRSPICILSIILIILKYITNNKITKKNKHENKSIIYLIIYFTSFILILFISNLFLQRFVAFSETGSDYSLVFRTYGSLSAGISVANYFPFFGIGPGNLEPAREYIIDALVASGAPEDAVVLVWKGSLNNALAASLVMFGYVGTFLFFGSIIWSMRRFTEKPRLPLYWALLSICVSYGAIYTPKFLVYLTVITAFARHFDAPRLQIMRRKTLGSEMYFAPRQNGG
jgi:hypothetical protein